MSHQTTPLVSVICLTYNKSTYVEETLTSVVEQTYQNIELIIVDDASKDNTAAMLKAFKDESPFAELILLDKNVGMCAAFNLGLKRCKGKYVIDLAGDDVLVPNRIEKQVAALEQAGKSYGVAFSDAWIINGKSEAKGTFYPRNSDGQLKKLIPQGDLYKYLIGLQLISSPTMMMRKSMLVEMGGYDETLSYEDYDFWIRSSRKYKYLFQDEMLTKKRVADGSSSTGWFIRKNNAFLKSTLRICQKAFTLNESKEEDHCLAVSVRYHLRQAVFMECFFLAKGYAGLLKKLDRLKLGDKFFISLAVAHISLNRPYQGYLKLKKLFLA
ncbi:glycosyltransferase family 2 protein [Flammeovirgaceae bacterium SG7u.111]|nr:glycosyltransferase family 2 protein [Flammeovirgaceae bacterium SG7u.132]WPO35179.1 glycosyltransferase family 2 protein [Flammeovirgaceae bacterium SG7u.111]